MPCARLLSKKAAGLSSPPFTCTASKCGVISSTAIVAAATELTLNAQTANISSAAKRFARLWLACSNLGLKHAIVGIDLYGIGRSDSRWNIKQPMTSAIRQNVGQHITASNGFVIVDYINLRNLRVRGALVFGFNA